jgi:hypothetical protein
MIQMINFNLIICEYPPQRNKGVFVSRLSSLKCVSKWQ